MIHSSTQLKDKIRNYSHGDSWKAQSLIRNFMMERFLERCACSPYHDYFVLKGGMLVASLVGLKMRTTMDVDATVQNYPLTPAKAKKMIEEIISIPLADQVTFTMQSMDQIMEEHDYPGIRFVLVAHMDKLRQPIKVDISTGDVITPAAIEYEYPLLFEKRHICILTYNLETVLAEKMETIIERSVANTRMRDYYDIVVLTAPQKAQIDDLILYHAYEKTSQNRKNRVSFDEGQQVLDKIKENPLMKQRWQHYQVSNSYASDIPWYIVMQNVKMLWMKIWGNFEKQ